MHIDRLLRVAAAAFASAVMLQTCAVDAYAANEAQVPETGNVGFATYMVPAVLAAVTVAAKKRKK